jgi:hypothetical protein
MTGLYSLPVDTIAYETGSPLAGAWKALRSFIEAGFCAYDENTETVWVFEMMRFQVGESLTGRDKRVVGIENSIAKYKNTPFYRQFIEKYRVSHNLSGCLEAPSKPLPSPFQAPSKPLGSQEKEQEKETEAVSSFPSSSEKEETENTLPQKVPKPKKEKLPASEKAQILAGIWFDRHLQWGDEHASRTTREKYVEKLARLWDTEIATHPETDERLVVSVLDFIDRHHGTNGFTWRDKVFSPEHLLTGDRAKWPTVLNQMRNGKPKECPRDKGVHLPEVEEEIGW